VGVVLPKPSFRPRTVCAACGEPVRPAELTVVGGTHPVRGKPLVAPISLAPSLSRFRTRSARVEGSWTLRSGRNQAR
jgi:hypothetical protein